MESAIDTLSFQSFIIVLMTANFNGNSSNQIFALAEGTGIMVLKICTAVSQSNDIVQGFSISS